MTKRTGLVLGVLIFIIIQIFIFTKLINLAVLTLVLAAIGGIFLYIRNAKFKVQLPNLSWTFAGAAALVAVYATITVKTYSKTALIMYVLSGILMLFAKKEGEGIFQQAELKTGYNKLEKWEPWFVAFLLLYTILLRFVALNDLPAGIYGHEIVQLGEAGSMGANLNNYIWHLGASAEWPSMTVYQGLFFADIFGWNIGSFRMEGAFWGTAVIIIFYFLARTMFSPSAAALSSLLFSSNAGQLLLSRNLAPNPILLASIMLATWLFITAMRRKDWRFYALSGLMLGFTLHGYIAGRILPAVLGIWCLYFLFFKKQMGLMAKDLGVMLLGFLISAGPIFYFAMKEPGKYWNYMLSVNPNAHAGIMSYIKTVIGTIPNYAGAFHIKGDMNPAMQMPCKNMLEPVAATLFPIGFFLSLFMIFKPIGLYNMTMFLLCLLPAMLGTGSSGHPTLSRMLGTFPAIYLMCALVFDRIKNVFSGFRGVFLRIILIVAAVCVVGYGSYNGLHEYFTETTTNRSFRIFSGYGNYLASKEMIKSKKDNILCSNLYDGFGYMTDYSMVKTIRWPEEYLILSPEKENLVLMDPFFKNIAPFLKEYFPNAQINIVDIKEDAQENMCGNHPIVSVHDPDTCLFSMRVPASDVKKFQQLINAETGESVDLNSREFRTKYADKIVRLKGALMMTEMESKATLKVNWPGWKVDVEGTGNRTTAEIGFTGVHYFTTSGRVPGEAVNQPLFDVVVDGKKVENRIAGLKRDYGMKLEFFKMGDLKKPIFIKNVIFPEYRVYDGYAINIPSPFVAVFSGYLKGVEKGDYKMNAEMPTWAIIDVNGKELFNSYSGAEKPSIAYCSLNPDKPATFKVTTLVTGGVIDRTYIFSLADRDGKNPKILDYNNLMLNR
jgi:hypothetical protein